MQAHLNSKGEIHHVWWRWTERRPLDRTFRSCNSHASVVTIHKPANGHDDGGREPKRPDRSGGYDAVRKSEAGYRQHLQVEGGPSGDSGPRTSVRSRTSNNKCGITN